MELAEVPGVLSRYGQSAALTLMNSCQTESCAAIEFDEKIL